jgi:23S rRNA pseudouridine1911/1915/1917 synthase
MVSSLSNQAVAPNALPENPIDYQEDGDADTPELIDVRLTVDSRAAGLRADIGLTRLMRRMRRHTARAVLEQLGVTGYLGRTVRPGSRLILGEELHWQRRLKEEPPLPEHIPIIWQDEWSIAVNKPVGIPVHATARYFRFSVMAYMHKHFPENTPQVAHRLDMDTTGVLLLYLPGNGHYFKNLFAERLTKKSYIAIVQGVVSEDNFTIDADIAQDPDTRLKGIRMKIVPKGQGMSSLTEVKVLARSDKYTLVHCFPRTGRQHQIRLHMFHAGYPLVGDRLYGQSDDFFKAAAAGLISEEDIVKEVFMRRQALHAYSLSFPRPNGTTATIYAPLPDDMSEFLAENFSGGVPDLTK